MLNSITNLKSKSKSRITFCQNMSFEKEHKCQSQYTASLLVLPGYSVILFSKFTTTDKRGSVQFLIHHILSYMPTVTVSFEVVSHSRALIKLPDA